MWFGWCWLRNRAGGAIAETRPTQEREIPAIRNDRKLSPDCWPVTMRALQAMLKRAMLHYAGAWAGLVDRIADCVGWRNAAMLAVGALISAASIVEWQRLVRLINAKLDSKRPRRGAATGGELLSVPADDICGGHLW